MPVSAPRSLRAALALGCAALLLSACPLASERPLADPGSAAADPELLGSWESRDEEGARLSLTFARVDGRLLAALAEDAGGEKSSYEAVGAELGGERFLSLRGAAEDAEDFWFHVNYRVEADGLRLRLVDDGLFADLDVDSPGALADLVLAHLSDPRLYGREEGESWDWTWTRVGPPR